MSCSTRRIGLALLPFVMATVVGPATAFASPPVPSSFGAAIEPLAAYDAQSTCSPTAKPGTVALRSLVQAAYPGTGDYGIVANCANGGVSEHYEGRAWDWKLSAYDPVQDAQAKDFFNWLFAPDAQGNRYAMARRLGIMYMIYNQHIWGSYYADQGWRPYTGSSPHTDHVHISLTRAGGDKLTSYWTGAGAGAPEVKTAAISAAYISSGAGAGPLGAPIGGEYSVTNGRVQAYERGRIYWSPTTGAHLVYGAILSKYLALGGPDSPLGLPTSDEGDVRGGRSNEFQRGAVYWSPATGAQAVYGAIYWKYTQSKGPDGHLGLPTSDETAVQGGRSNAFENGRIYWSGATGPHVVGGAVLARYAVLGGPESPLGLPVTDEQDAPQSARMNGFQGGAVYWSASTGSNAVYGAIAVKYAALGNAAGWLGLPTSSESDTAGGRFSTFQGGRIYWSAATGPQSVRGAILATWLRYGGSGGPIGMPTTDETDVAGGKQGSFTAGDVYWSPATGASVLAGAAATKYLALGGPAGLLGFPVSDQQSVSGGSVALFQQGRIYVSGAFGASEVHGAILATYLAAGGPATLGLPTSDESASGSGRMSAFTQGRIYWSGATGAHVVGGAVLAHLDSQGGVGGYLGMPTSDLRPAAAGVQEQIFSGGRVLVGPGGAFAVRGAILLVYLSLGGAAGPLGAPTSDEYAVPEGRRSDFVGGHLLFNASTGKVTTG